MVGRQSFNVILLYLFYVSKDPKMDV